MKSHIVAELHRRLNPEEKLTLEEANVLRSLQSYKNNGYAVGAIVGSGLTWIATRRLTRFNRIGSPIGTRSLIQFTRIGLSIVAAGLSAIWGCETSVNSWIDQVCALEGSRIQKELASVIVQKFPDDPRRKQLISKHFSSERVFDGSTSDQLQLRRWYWNFCVDNAAFSQSTPDSDNYSDSDSKQNDLESKQVPMDSDNYSDSDSKQNDLESKQVPMDSSPLGNRQGESSP